MKRLAAVFLWATAIVILLAQLPAAAQSYSSSPGTVSTTWTVGGPRGLAYPSAASSGQVLTATSPTAAAWSAAPTIPSLTGVSTTTGYLQWTGSAYAWGTPGGGFSAGGDLGGSSSSQEVLGLLSQALPSLATGYLSWNGSAWVFSSPTTGITQLTGDGTAGPGSGSQVLTLANSGVTAGTYPTSPGDILQAVVDAKGRVTNAAQVAIGVGNANLVAGSYPNITGVGALTSGSLGAGVSVNFSAITPSGTLPSANQACQALGGSGGDATGDTCTPHVNSAASGIQVGSTTQNLMGCAPGCIAQTGVSSVPTGPPSGETILWANGTKEVVTAANGLAVNCSGTSDQFQATCSGNNLTIENPTSGTMGISATGVINVSSPAGVVLQSSAAVSVDGATFSPSTDLGVASSGGTTTISATSNSVDIQAPSGQAVNLFGSGGAWIVNAGPAGIDLEDSAGHNFLAVGANDFFAKSGSAGSETVIYKAAGTPNTQNDLYDKVRFDGTLTSTGILINTSMTSNLPVGHSAILDIKATCRCIVAGTSTVVGDSFFCHSESSYKNTGTPLLNTLTTIHKEADASILLTSSACTGFGTAFEPTVQIAPTTGSLGTWDCTMWSTPTVN